MSEQTPIGGSSTQIPPPPSFASIAAAANPGPRAADLTADEQEQAKVRAAQAEAHGRMQTAKEIGLVPGTEDYQEYVATGKWPTRTHYQHTTKVDKQTGQPVNFNPDAGDYVDQNGQVVPSDQIVPQSVTIPKLIQYVGPNGEALPGFQTGDKLYDRDGKELPSDAKMFHPSTVPTHTVTQGVRMVQQPDGTTLAIPVTTTQVRTRGGAGVPPPPKAGTRASASTTAGAGTSAGSGRVVGGKVPPGVAKAYETYSAAQERYAVMLDALPRAMKGDQQAMVNLLANHIGMTMGLQKGGRITQALYEEAAESAPWLSRVAAHFDKDGYLTGVVLTPEQMTQMIDLAKVRLDQDKQAWQREVSAARSGYGMNDPANRARGGPTPLPSGSRPPLSSFEH